MVDPQAELLSLRTQMQQMYSAFQQQLQQQVASVSSAASSSQSSVPRLDLPRIRQPSTFAGAMGFAVDDWISEMEQQFSYYGAKFPDDGVRVRYASAYLSGPAMHWWEQQPDRGTLADWAEFISRLHDRFRPVQAAMLARQRLGKLRMKENHSVNQYVSVFQTTLTPITDMGDTDQVHHFVNGLPLSIAAKVWERHPTTLKQAIDYAVLVEAMGNFGRAALPMRSSSAGHSHMHGKFAGSASAGYSNSTSGTVPMDLNHVSLIDEFVTEETSSASGARSAGTTANDSVLAAIMAQMESMTERLNAIGQGNNPFVPVRSDRIAGLKPEEITRMRKEGLCFRCKKKGHMKNECPSKPKN